MEWGGGYELTDYNDLADIKKKILNDSNIIPILEAIGCEYIKPFNKRIEAQLPFDKFQSQNHRACQVYLSESLTCSIRNRSDFKKSDIFSLVSYILHGCRTEKEIREDLYNAKKFICELLGYKEFLQKGSYKKKIDYVSSLKQLHRRKRKFVIEENEPIPEWYLDDYVKLPYYGWLQEGINYQTQLDFQIGFDLQSNRITIPIYNKDGHLIGVKGRIIEDELDDRKYLYLHQFNAINELFNFHRAKEHIVEENKVILFESEKSVMKMHSKGIYNTVAIGCSSVSETQAKLIKNCGIGIKIILAYDKDKTIEEIREASKVFGNRDVYAIFDTKGLLNEKDSPIDQRIEVWNELERDCCYLITKEVENG